MYIFIKQNKCGPFSQELVLVNVEQPHAVELRQLGKRDDHQGYSLHGTGTSAAGHLHLEFVHLGRAGNGLVENGNFKGSSNRF